MVSELSIDVLATVNGRRYGKRYRVSADALMAQPSAITEFFGMVGTQVSGLLRRIDAKDAAAMPRIDVAGVVE